MYSGPVTILGGPSGFERSGVNYRSSLLSVGETVQAWHREKPPGGPFYVPGAAFASEKEGHNSPG
jgi:hypothetical protein